MQICIHIFFCTIILRLEFLGKNMQKLARDTYNNSIYFSDLHPWLTNLHMPVHSSHLDA